MSNHFQSWQSLINQACSRPQWKNVGSRSFLYALSRPLADLPTVQPLRLVNKIYLLNRNKLIFVLLLKIPLRWRLFFDTRAFHKWLLFCLKLFLSLWGSYRKLNKLWSKINLTRPPCGWYPELGWKTINEAETWAFYVILHKDFACGFLGNLYRSLPWSLRQKRCWFPLLVLSSLTKSSWNSSLRALKIPSFSLRSHSSNTEAFHLPLKRKFLSYFMYLYHCVWLTLQLPPSWLALIIKDILRFHSLSWRQCFLFWSWVWNEIQSLSIHSNI